MRARLRGPLVAVQSAIVVLVTRAVLAEPPSPCPAAPDLQSSTVSVDTKVAADALTQVLAKLGVGLDVHRTRDSVLKDNPRADQAIIVLTMAHTFCEMIWADTTLSGAQKAQRYGQMMSTIFVPAAGPVPVARTDGKQSRYRAPRAYVMLASTAQAAEGEPQPKLPVPSQQGFLRDPPFYINDTNKYFVIVASPGSEDEGKRMLGKLKAKAPQYDFVLYGPYGTNTRYGIMMATWVPRDVATEALRLARRDVSPDAYLWACRGTGESC